MASSCICQPEAAVWYVSVGQVRFVVESDNDWASVWVALQQAPLAWFSDFLFSCDWGSFKNSLRLLSEQALQPHSKTPISILQVQGLLSTLISNHSYVWWLMILLITFYSNTSEKIELSAMLIQSFASLKTSRQTIQPVLYRPSAAWRHHWPKSSLA